MGGTWHLRDIIDYQSIAWESLLYQAATKRADLLRYFYDINKNNVERTTPYAFVIPARQNDPGAAKKMLETLAFGDIEIERAAQRFTADGKDYCGRQLCCQHAPAFFRLGQNAARTPGLSGSAPLSRRSAQAAVRRHRANAAHADGRGYRGTVKDSVSSHAPAGHAVLLRARPCQTRGRVGLRPMSRPGRRSRKSGNRASRFIATRLPAIFTPLPASGRREIPAPRIGLYQAYIPSMDEGWTRWLFDEFRLRAEQPLVNADIQPPEICGRSSTPSSFPDQSRQTIANGHRAESMPPEYHGRPGRQRRGGVEGIRRAGRHADLLNHAADYATRDLGVKAKNVLEGRASRRISIRPARC